MSTTDCALATPSKAQLDWHAMEVQMFVHLDPFWHKLDNPPEVSEYSPDQFNADEWVDVAESIGAKQLVLVAKHGSGFCHWPTSTTNFSIASSPWKDGKGDLVREVADACHRRGMKLGIYIAPMSKEMNVGCGGKAPDEVSQKAYDQVFRTQLTELLSQYGPVSEVWFDGSLVVEVGDILKKYVPDAIIFQGKYANIRWPGTETGVMPYPAWNSVMKKDADTGIATSIQGTPEGDVWMPLEADTTIRDHIWFWTPDGEEKLKSLDQLMDTYYQSVGHGAVLLLNANPDHTGKIPAADAKRAAEFGAEVCKRFSTPICETSGQGDQVILTLPEETEVDHVILMEDIAMGERVHEYVLEGNCGGEWVTLSEGISIGYKKIDFFAPKKLSAIRVRVTKSAAEPQFKCMAAYHVGTIPTFERNAIKISNPMQIGEWEMGEEETSFSATFNVSHQCRMPGRYEIEFVPEEGFADIDVTEMTFLNNGLPCPEEFLIPMSSRLVWDLTVTAYEVTKEVTVQIVKSGNGPSKGKIVSRPC